jgi:hypothetical protein
MLMLLPLSLTCCHFGDLALLMHVAIVIDLLLLLWFSVVTSVFSIVDAAASVIDLLALLCFIVITSVV